MSPLRGIILKLCAVMCFITMMTLIKAAGPRFPPGEVVFFRSFFALPLIVAWLAWRGDLASGFRVVSPTAHILRGILGTVAMGCNFAALSLLPLPEVTALGYTMPLLVVVFAAMFLNEKVGPFRYGAVALGMVGVGIVIIPRLTLYSGDSIAVGQATGVVLVLFGSTCAALTQVHIRNMVRTEQTSAIVFWFSATSSVLALMTLPFGWAMPQGWDWALLLLPGLIGGLGQICLTSSYRFADASLVAPFDYASMIFAVLIGYFVFAEVPTVQTLAGAALVIVAGVVIILRERHLGLKRDAAKQAKSPIA